MLNKKIRNTTIGVLITLFLLWGGLWLYYQIALQLSGMFSSLDNFGPDTSQGTTAKYLQDDMERYRSIHGTYPSIGEKCQDIFVLKPYLTGSITTGKYPRDLYDYQWFLAFLYPKENILLHPQPLWKFSVSVKSDGSAYVFRVEDRNDTLTGIMHFVARYIVWADQSNEKMLSLEYIPMFGGKNVPLSGIQLGCDCTGKNYCVGDKNTVQSQLKQKSHNE